MFKFILTLLFSTMLLSVSNASDLEDKIRAIIDQDDARIAVSLIPQSNLGEEIHIRGDENFHAASTYKTPVMLEAYRRSLNDPDWNIGDSLKVYNEFKSIVDGSSYEISQDDDRPGIAEHIGEYLPIRRLIEHMIIQSGNLATNILIDQLSADSVTTYMHDMGLTGLQIRRGVYDMPAFEEGINNETTARDLSRMFYKLGNGEMLDEATTNEVIDILKRQAFRDMIPAKLPGAIEVAHKTGSITGVNHDSGIVYLPNGGWYALTLLSDESEDEERTVEILAETSRIIFEYFAK